MFETRAQGSRNSDRRKGAATTRFFHRRKLLGRIPLNGGFDNGEDRYHRNARIS